MKKITSILVTVIGIAMIIYGATWNASIPDNTVKNKIYSHSSQGYSVRGAAFGADFYTYTYDALDTIVDELDSIDSGLSALLSAETGIYQATAANIETVTDLSQMISKSVGLIFIGFGLTVLAIGLTQVGSAFTITKKETAAPVPAPAAEMKEETIEI